MDDENENLGSCVVGGLDFELRPMADRNELLKENMNIKRKISTVSKFFSSFFVKNRLLSRV